MGYKYVVLGAGRQGVAAAYDLQRHGQAQGLVIADQDEELARRAADRVNGLLQSDVVESAVVDVTVESALVPLLRGVDAVVSAVPYRFNLGVARAAIEAGANMCLTVG
jgi:lysine 6-dehydrogenase